MAHGLGSDADVDTAYGLRLLGEAVARRSTGIAAAPVGHPRGPSILRALQALAKEGLVEVIADGGRVLGAEMTDAGIVRGKAIAGRSGSPVRMPGDVVDVVRTIRVARDR